MSCPGETRAGSLLCQRVIVIGTRSLFSGSRLHFFSVKLYLGIALLLMVRPSVKNEGVRFCRWESAGGRGCRGQGAGGVEPGQEEAELRRLRLCYWPSSLISMPF